MLFYFVVLIENKILNIIFNENIVFVVMTNGHNNVMWIQLQRNYINRFKCRPTKYFRTKHTPASVNEQRRDIWSGYKIPDRNTLPKLLTVSIC